MSQIFRSHGVRWAWLVFVGAALQPLGLVQLSAAEPTEQPKSTAIIDTYREADGRGYFALKLIATARQPATPPHDVVILFDTSASQIGAYRDKALSALRSLLAGLTADDRVALLAVDVQAIKLTDTFSPPGGAAMTQALAALDRRVPLGSTDMPAALEAALAAWPAARDPGRERAVIYIGDGFSVASLVPMEMLERIAGQYADRQVACTSYGIGPRVNAELLGALANHTGGMLVPDVEGASGRQVGGYLAAVARGSVIWPASTALPAAIKTSYPKKMPPLRFDRDSVLIGTFDPQAAPPAQRLTIEMRGELAGKQVTLNWKTTLGDPQDDNAYLAKVVEWAAFSQGVALPTAGSASLADMRRWVTFGAQQLAQLGERALAVGRTDEAAQLAGEAERLDPVNAQADVVRAAAARRSHPPAAEDLRMTPAKASFTTAADTDGPADGQLLDDIERQKRVVQGFLWAEVTDSLNHANSVMSVDPEGTRDQLKLLLEKVQRTAEVSPEARTQMVDRIESGLRAASRIASVKTELDLRHQEATAAAEARDRINRDLLIDQQKVDQLMSRFDALMAEERYRDAEVVAGLAEEMQPNQPGLRTAELTARTTAHTAGILGAREMRHKGGFDMLYGVELSNIPTADDPPIIYPDPGVWQLLSERRKKYKAVDLTEPGPSEAKILEALDEPTDMDFTEQPLADVVDYLRQRHGIEIQLDKKALTDSGVGSEVPITRSLKGITLRSALKLVLGEIDLTYVLRNEVLMITSKAEAENMLSTRVYPLADLVVPITPPRNMNGPAAGGMGGGFLGMPMGGSMGGGMGMGGMGMGGMGMGMGGMGGMGGGMGGMGGMGGGMGFF
ncbi:MAG TPA: vWA domain-containing protein [Pirellulales bacterium]|nr:vWA domain-containing protein [Pirellulales bacterium]